MNLIGRSCRLVWLGLILVCVCATGCKSSDGFGYVSGKVTLDGKPLEDAQVVFISQSGGSTSYGRTDKNGEFSMIFSRSVKGAFLGENLVRITTADVVMDEKGNEIKKPELVPEKYNATSEEIRNVESGSNYFEFKLTSG